MASLWFAACSDDDPQGLQPDETPMLVVVYPIDGLGDRSYVDNIYRGVEKAALQYGLKVQHLMPYTYEEGTAYIENFMKSEAEEPNRRLYIITEPTFEELVTRLAPQFAESDKRQLLFIETRKEIPHAHTLYLPFYRVNFAAGRLAQQMTDVNRVAIFQANEQLAILKEATQGFSDGFAAGEGQSLHTYIMDEGFLGFSMADKLYQEAYRINDLFDLVLPLSSSALDRTHYERTAEWFVDNFRQAQAGCDQGITLELEWYDEDTEDLSALAAELASRPELAAMVGPQRSTSVDVMGSAFASAEKPMIVPVASSEEIIRKFSCNEAGSFSDTPFLWSLTETDISQSEVMLSIVTSTGGKSIALLTPDDVYGKTFAEWMPFLANELGIELLGQYRFTGASDFRPAARQLLASGADFALCICDDDELTAQLLQLRQQAGDAAPRLLFSDAALSSELLKQGTAAEGIEGVAMYADPTSGFQISYEERFQELPTMSEAQLYDALLLTGFAAFYCQHTGEKKLNKAIQTITSQRDSHGLNAWDEMGMTQYLTQMEKQHYLIDFRGASGEIKFDAEAYTSVLHSTYVHWVVHDGKLVALDYASSDGNNRTEGTLASWNWRAQSQQAIDDEEADIHYGELHDRWALLVAGSENWSNYRHQSDVLNVYQLLKRQGWDDDHIILVMRDDLAYHGSNPQPGEIYASVGGDNLYQEVQIDYRADTLSTADICSILRGERSSHLPVVVESDLHSNLFLYWSGHGLPGYFSWLDAADRLTTDMLSQTLAQMQAESRYRKLLFCAEPCFSSSVAKAAEGIPGVLSIASASETEYSFADNYSVAFRAWLSDRFSNNLVDCMSQTPEMTYRELYTYLVSHTLGSHVKIFNAPQFGNLYRESPKEFFVAG